MGLFLYQYQLGSCIQTTLPLAFKLWQQFFFIFLVFLHSWEFVWMCKIYSFSYLFPPSSSTPVLTFLVPLSSHMCSPTNRPSLFNWFVTSIRAPSRRCWTSASKIMSSALKNWTMLWSQRGNMTRKSSRWKSLYRWDICMPHRCL